MGETHRTRHGGGQASRGLGATPQCLHVPSARKLSQPLR